MTAKDSNKTLSTRQYTAAIVRVASLTYKASPPAIIVKLIGSLLSAVLPIVTTYFAALTTTALAEARIFKHLFADKKRTVITISHRLTMVDKADVIFMLQEGKIVERGTHKELVEKRGAYFTMFESQLR